MFKRIFLPAGPPPVFAPTWGPVMALVWTALIFIVSYVVAFVFEQLGLVIFDVPGADTDPLKLQMFAQPIQIVLLLVVVSRFRLNPLDALALRSPKNIRQLFAVIVAIVAVSFLILIVIQSFIDDDEIKDPSQETNEREVRRTGLLKSLLTTGAIAPVTEELFFRGLLLQSFFKTRLWFWGAAVITSAMFALIHNPASANILVHATYFIMGFALALALRLTGSLWMPIGLHIVKNTLAVFIVLYG